MITTVNTEADAEATAKAGAAMPLTPTEVLPSSTTAQRSSTIAPPQTAAAESTLIRA